MNSSSQKAANCSEVRPDFIHKERYTSREFAELEKERLWPRVWQWACRLEEIPGVGDYVVYDITDQSVIVVRTGDAEVKAFHNVCPHRGRRLLSGKGHINKFHCIFHAWQWSLDGVSTRILDQEQWEGCPGMSSADLALTQVHTAEWAGFVFINLAEEPEPFDEFIQPAPECLDVLAIGKMRYGWHLLIEVECNWKVAQESFMESYHLWGTHPQFLPVIDEKNISRAMGKHGQHIYLTELPPGMPSRRLERPELSEDEVRQGFSDFIGALGQQVGDKNMNGQLTARSVHAAQKALAELPSGTPIYESIGAAVMAMKAAADADGAYFPMVSPEHRAEKLGEDWNIFPTMSIVPSFDGTLIFRARPRGDNPDHCYIEMISLLHWGKGKAPKVEMEHIRDWRTQGDSVPSLLMQDLRNMGDVQKGLHSMAFKGARPNPVQEVQISHFHEVINEYLFD